MGDANRSISVGLLAILSIVIMITFAPSAASTQAIEAEGNFEGTTPGYAEGEGDWSNLIETAGEFTITGEDAQNVRVVIESGPETVLDQSSVEPFVEGQVDISFDQTNRGDSVVLRTEEVPSGTTVQLNFASVFVGGSQAETINAGQITVNYETEGGTSSEQTFESETDMSSSADNRLSSLQSEMNSLEQWRLMGIGGVAFGFLMLVVAFVIFWVNRDKGGPPSQSSGGGPPTGGPPN